MVCGTATRRKRGNDVWNIRYDDPGINADLATTDEVRRLQKNVASAPPQIGSSAPYSRAVDIRIDAFNTNGLSGGDHSILLNLLGGGGSRGVVGHDAAGMRIVGSTSTEPGGSHAHVFSAGWVHLAVARQHLERIEAASFRGAGDIHLSRSTSGSGSDWSGNHPASAAQVVDLLAEADVPLCDVIVRSFGNNEALAVQRTDCDESSDSLLDRSGVQLPPDNARLAGQSPLLKGIAAVGGLTDGTQVIVDVAIDVDTGENEWLMSHDARKFPRNRSQFDLERPVGETFPLYQMLQLSTDIAKALGNSAKPAMGMDQYSEPFAEQQFGGSTTLQFVPHGKKNGGVVQQSGEIHPLQLVACK